MYKLLLKENKNENRKGLADDLFLKQKKKKNKAEENYNTMFQAELNILKPAFGN